MHNWCLRRRLAFTHARHNFIFSEMWKEGGITVYSTRQFLADRALGLCFWRKRCLFSCRTSSAGRQCTTAATLPRSDLSTCAPTRMLSTWLVRVWDEVWRHRVCLAILVDVRLFPCLQRHLKFRPAKWWVAKKESFRLGERHQINSESDLHRGIKHGRNRTRPLWLAGA